MEKFDHGKKSLLFEWCLMLIQKYTSLLAGKILLNANDFLPSKVKYIFCFNAICCSNMQNFFPLGNPPYAKKCKRDSLYFDLLPGPFKSAIFFIFVHSIKNNKRKETILEIKCFFYCKFIYLIQFFEYKKCCNAITKQA